MSQESRSRSGRSFGQRFCQLLLRLAGWRVAPFPDLDQAVVVGGPHTSNWDGVLGVVGGMALGLHVNIMIKNSLFKGPLGMLLRRLGAIPIDRARAAGVVEQAVEQFQRHDHLILVVTPEGTRTGALKWKTGFYHIANRARVPVIVATADYGTKRLTFPLVFTPTGDIDGELHRIYQTFAAVTPRHPEKLSAPVKALWQRGTERR